MISLADARLVINAYTTGRCGLMHHHAWTHGKELPQCPKAVRDGLLDCAHTDHPGLSDVIEALAVEPTMPPGFVKSVRGAIAAGRDALWLAELLAIELSDASLHQLAGRELTRVELQVVQEAEALRSDGSIDHSRCEEAIKRAHVLGSDLMTEVKKALQTALSVIDTTNNLEQVEQLLADCQSQLAATTDRVERECFKTT